MKLKPFSSLLLVFAMTLFLFACGGDANYDKTEDTTNTEVSADENAEPTASTEETTETDKTGKEYTSAYVCPMHCDGSGSAEAGKCPVCKMDYVANTDHTEDGHDHSHDGHEHN